MHWKTASALLVFFAKLGASWPYDEALIDYNLNENPDTKDPAEYWGEWPNHTYFPSPENWRFPVYTLFLDRFVNGDPTNDNINGTFYEHDLNSNQMRHGGDVSGLVDTLDYLQGMGIKVRKLCDVHLSTHQTNSACFFFPFEKGHLSGRHNTNESTVGIGRLFGLGYDTIGPTLRYFAELERCHY